MGKFENLGRTVTSALAAIIISTACISAAVGPAATGAPQIASVQVQGQAQQA